MTIQMIQATAMKHFIQNGYEGTKLAHIAIEVGIKKQSLNYYYISKTALFEDLLQLAKSSECDYIQKYFSTHTDKNLEKILYEFLFDYSVRFYESTTLGFLSVLSFVPPLSLREQTLHSYREYNDCIKKELSLLFTKESQKISCSVDSAVRSFITLLDGLQIQLVYETKEQFNEALQAIWDIYWAGLTK